MKNGLFEHQHRTDIILLTTFPILVAFATSYFELNYIIATFLFFGLPSIYLSLKNPARFKRSLIFSLILLGIFSLIIDYPAYVDKSWFVPNSAFRFLDNSTPIEDIIWAFLWVFFAITFWEYFLDKSGNHRHFSRNLRYLIVLGALMLSAFFSAYFLKPEILNIPYFYLKFGLILFAVPIALVLLRFHKLIPKVFSIGLYFFFISFLTEVVGLQNKHWLFDGPHFIATFNFFGHLIPLEEIVFWWGLGVPGIICWYEFFGDDHK
ncbi:MAG: hypothetical protein A2916_00520 [Candidatus Yanofskybacteria bacterium RIFCSPLOWO2_01_FULL_41_67]|nr:MAG: hypothetical protein A2916_00520 [Candidatus Yanofskybacteria bacterium RIFCSPLOWO2_01_FULL_41_67]